MQGIRGLTTREALQPTLGIPLFGKLFKGGKKSEKRPGTDLDYFRVEFTPQYRYLRQTFEKLMGAPADREPKEIEIALMGNRIENVFGTAMEAYAYGTLIHRCDMVTQSRRYDKDKEHHVSDDFPL